MLSRAIDRLIQPSIARDLDEIYDVAADALEHGQDVAPVLVLAGDAGPWFAVSRQRWRVPAPLQLEDRRAHLHREILRSLGEELARVHQQRFDEFGNTAVHPSSMVVDVVLDQIANTYGMTRDQIAYGVEVTPGEGGRVDVTIRAPITQVAYVHKVEI